MAIPIPKDTFVKLTQVPKSPDKKPPITKKNGLDHKKQVILYGPPGTGKTYSAFIKAHEILFDEKNVNATFSSIKDKLIESGSEEIDVSDLTWVDSILLAFDELKSDKATVTELKETQIIEKVKSFKNRERNISNTLWSILQQYSVENSTTVKYKHKNGKEIFDKDESSHWFIADSGKEYSEIRLNEIKSTPPRTPVKQLSFVTFHQSYSYEDFIEGYRPVKDEDTVSETIDYDLHDGIFKKMCNLAKEDPKHNYVMIIDEINRGNISKIFGELITLIEDNKRIGETEEIIVTLPYSGDEFGVPSNVYIVGTMNSTDKSIALVDIALRRRFKFEKILPDYSLINNASARSLLENLNEKICALKNSDFVIGHSYFMRIPDTDENNEKLKEVFINQVLPLLEEYFFNDWDALATILDPKSIRLTKPVLKMYWNESDSKFKENDNDYEKLIGRTLEEPEKIFENIKKLYFS